MKILLFLAVLLLVPIARAQCTEVRAATVPTGFHLVLEPNGPGLDAPLTSDETVQAMGRAHKEKYPHRVLDGLDQFFGAIIGLQNDQTISSATEIAAHGHKWNRVLAVPLNVSLDLIQRSHGELAQAGDLERSYELIATDARALTNETGVAVIPVVGGVKLVKP